MTIKSTKWYAWTCIQPLVVWTHEFLVTLQKFFHCCSTQPCGASLSIHYDVNRRRQLYWSNVWIGLFLPNTKKGQRIGLLSVQMYVHVSCLILKVRQTTTCPLPKVNNEIKKYDWLLEGNAFCACGPRCIDVTLIFKRYFDIKILALYIRYFGHGINISNLGNRSTKYLSALSSSPLLLLVDT